MERPSPLVRTVLRIKQDRSLCAVLLAMMSATPLVANPVPSGQEATLHEVLVDAQDSTTYLRFRYITPQIADGAQKIGFAVAGEDMMHLCQTFALPYIDQYALEGDKIVISFMDRITEFGVPDPDATQYFESFRPKNGVCMWDEF
tara:strand:- start:185 stop:619 length:435 start_codon:yes stop_codon:yes gene_type:complete